MQAKPAKEAEHLVEEVAKPVKDESAKQKAEVEEGRKSMFDVEESGIPSNVSNQQEMLDNAVRAYNDVLSRINPMQPFGEELLTRKRG